MNDENLGLLRRCLFAITGLSCLAYAVLALTWQRPDPFAWYIPGVFGIAAAVILYVSTSAGDAAAKHAWDERYRHLATRAAASAFWIMLFSTPLLAIAQIRDWISAETSFAALGTLAAASYLLMNVWFDWKDS